MLIDYDGANVLEIAIWILIVTVTVQAVLTWVSPYSPARPLLNRLVSPFLRVFQRRVPPVGNVDLSPLFVLVVCYLLLMVVLWLERGID